MRRQHEKAVGVRAYGLHIKRAYIESHVPLLDSLKPAVRWGEQPFTLIASHTRAIEATPGLDRCGIPVGVTSRRGSKYKARPAGTVIAWCLDLDDVLDLERDRAVTGIVLIRAWVQHRPWATAFAVPRLGGEELPPVPEASETIKAMVDGITFLAVPEQGLLDNREKHPAIEALTYMHRHGHRLDPDQLVVEALRNGWPGYGARELADIARKITGGTRMRFTPSLSDTRLAEWSALSYV